MADFTTVMTDTAALDDSVIKEFDQQFLVALAEQGVADQFVTFKREIGAKSIGIPKYAQLSLATTPLVEKEDPASEAMSDTEVLLTPLEYGKVVTTTKLANFQTGGKADVAASRLVGINAGRTQNRLAMLTMDASTNIRRVNDRATDALLVAGDVVSGSELGIVYNKLSRANVVGAVGGEYALIMHDDIIHDLREETGVGSFMDVHKYALPGEVLKNEVGMYKGFRVIRDNLSTISADAGTGNVDVYHSYAVGFNGLGKAVSSDVVQKVTGPFDKLGRFLNIGWLGYFVYGIVEPEAIWVLRSSSSVGDNA